jgi:hypothetical protein
VLERKFGLSVVCKTLEPCHVRLFSHCCIREDCYRSLCGRRLV